MGNLAGWPYWKVVSITGQAGSGTDYQVELEIGDSAGGDFHLEGHCTNFPQDIRITDDDGTTLLDHFVEDLTADPIVVHVEVKDNLDSNQDIRIYYGKSGENTASNGTNTYLSFFNGDSTGWTEVDPNSHISFTNNRLEWSELNRDEDAYVYQANANVNGDIVIEFTSYITSFSSNGWGGVGTIGDMLDDYNNLDNGIKSFRYYPTDTNLGKKVSDVGSVSAVSVAISTGTQYWSTTTINRSGNAETKIYSDSARTNQVGSTMVLDVSDVVATLDNVFLILSLNTGDSTFKITGWMDDFRIRKYNSPEPAFSSAGAEQSPTGVSPTGVFCGPLVGPFGGPI